MKNRVLMFICLTFLTINNTVAEATTQGELERKLERCILDRLKQQQLDAQYLSLKQGCEQTLKLKQQHRNAGAISKRFISERQTAYNPFVITPHKRNYILFASHSNNINRDVYAFAPWSDHLSHTEAKFQLSIKVPLSFNTLLVEGDALFLGFTLQAWWQIYSENISKPFRETNYQPEIFYMMPLNWHPQEGNTGLIFGLEHESNGKSQPLSRSWNRLYSEFVFEKDNFVFAIKPWWRLPEPEKRDPLDADGDDNPDINHYYGYFEIGAAHKWKRYEVALMARRNFKHDQGAFELSFTFPMWGRLRGFAQYFNGYGESLIDYNHRQQRFGIGVALTGLL